jgi:1-acyl-sn-glycerol-3-phosphate acyltransferase
MGCNDALMHTCRSLVVFPEGTRNAEGVIGPFKKGGIILAIEAGWCTEILQREEVVMPLCLFVVPTCGGTADTRPVPRSF